MKENLGLGAIVPEGFVEINPEDARRLGISDKSLAEVVSRRGKIQTRARVKDRAPYGTIFIYAISLC